MTTQVCSWDLLQLLAFSLLILGICHCCLLQFMVPCPGGFAIGKREIPWEFLSLRCLGSTGFYSSNMAHHLHFLFFSRDFLVFPCFPFQHLSAISRGEWAWRRWWVSLLASSQQPSVNQTGIGPRLPRVPAPQCRRFLKSEPLLTHAHTCSQYQSIWIGKRQRLEAAPTRMAPWPKISAPRLQGCDGEYGVARSIKGDATYTRDKIYQESRYYQDIIYRSAIPWNMFDWDRLSSFRPH